jgi:chaperonin cofactor prefoldin
MSDRLEKLKSLREQLLKDYGCSKQIENEIREITREINILEGVDKDVYD